MPDPVPKPETETLRERLAALLREATWPADQLAAELEIERSRLEQELAHLERSARRRGERVVVEPARCLACGAVCPPRDARPFHAPRRCPSCKQERMAWPSYGLKAR
jgi:predicted Zn-ribbon and HTH transcriptional regulator